MTAYHRNFDADGNPVDRMTEKAPLATRFVPITEIAANEYDLNIGRYVKQAAAETEDLGTLIDAYNIARSERQKAEARMLAVLADAGIAGFDE